MTQRSGMFHLPGGDMNASYVRNTFVALSAEAGLASLDAATTYSATAACFNCWNQTRAADTSNQNVIIIPRLLRLTAKAVNTTASDMRFHIVLDNTNRYSSGGTELTPVTTSDDEPTAFVDYTPKAKIYAGELTLAAASAAKIIARVLASVTILAANDVIELWFGTPQGGSMDGTGQTRTVITVAPVVIGRNQNMSVHEVATAQAADPKFQYEFWYEEHNHSRV